MHLGFDLLLEQDLAALENFLNVRSQLARLRIDNREFLLDSEGVRVVVPGHVGEECALRRHKSHPSGTRITSVRGRPVVGACDNRYESDRRGVSTIAIKASP